MQRRLFVVVLIVLASVFSTTACAQADSQAKALRDYVAGQKFSVTYRQGGPVYGTYFFLSVNLCRSGDYVTFGRSRKQSVLDSRETGLPSAEQVRSWRDQGRWSVTARSGQLGVQYVSFTGQTFFYPVRVQPNGQILVGNGMTVLRDGAARCQ